MAMAETPTTPRRSGRRLIYGVLFLAAGVALVLGALFTASRRQQRAVEDIRALGGRVSYDFEVDENGDLPGDHAPSEMSWMARCCGVDFVHHVRRVDLAGTPVRDLSLLRPLSQLRRLNFDRTLVSDLGPLQHMLELRRLDLQATQVEDLWPLQNLKRLRHLDLYGTEVRDLTPLQELHQLEHLGLSGTDVDDLTPLMRLYQLQYLGLSGARVSEEATERLRKARPRLLIITD